jgi:isoquinoline 1-oxidoreductase beta subunit
VAVEAARLAKAAGVPVHVGWTRSEELRHGYFRPPTHHKLRASLGDNGRIVAMEHLQASGDVAAQFLPAAMIAVMGADFGAYRGAMIPYAVENRRTVAAHHNLPVRTGWWRGLGLLANTFAVESFIDELAHLAGADPLHFRLEHLPDDERGRRLRATLEAVAAAAEWDTPPPAGRARGLACSRDGETMVAEVAEISLDEATGRIRVHRVTAAMDCGLVINPDGAKAQIEGNIMWGIGSTLLEEVRIRDGQVEAGNFDTYPLLSMADAPDVEAILLPGRSDKPFGVGEPPIAPVAAAIGNALFALSGARVRQLPMTPERIRQSIG